MAVDQWIGTTSGSLTLAANFKSGVALVSGDGFVVPQTATQAIDANLDLSAVTLVSFETEANSPVNIGKWSDADLIEYAKFTLLHSGTYYNAILKGTAESFLHFINYALIHVDKAPSASSSNYGLNITGTMDGTGAGKVLITSTSGTVGLAATIDEVFEAEEVKVIGANVTLGEGVFDPDGSSPMPLLDVKGGTVVNRAALVTLNVDSSKFTHDGGNITTFTLKAGSATTAGIHTITTLNLWVNAQLDTRGDLQAKTLTTVNMSAGSVLDIRGLHVTITNPINLIGCGHHEVTVRADPGQTISFA